METHYKLEMLAKAIHEIARVGYDEEGDKYTFQVWGAIYELSDGLLEHYSELKSEPF